MDTICDCYNIFDINSNVNTYVCLKFVKVETRIYNIIVALQFQWKGAFLDKVVPLFRLNKFIYYILFCGFILRKSSFK